MIFGGVFADVQLRVTFLWAYPIGTLNPMCLHTGVWTTRFHSISNSVQEM
jgi:hypothetical protein